MGVRSASCEAAASWAFMGSFPRKAILVTWGKKENFMEKGMFELISKGPGVAVGEDGAVSCEKHSCSVRQEVGLCF